MLDLKPLDESVRKMADFTLSSLKKAYEAYSIEKKNEILNDETIDNFECLIEEDCLKLILKERPFAGDLRKITGIFKAVSDFERIGDHAEDVLWCISNLKRGPHFEVMPLLSLILEKSMAMVKDSFDAFLSLDEKKSQNVIDRDDEVYKLYAKIVEDIALSREKGNNDVENVYSILLAKYAERVADHSTNIAEWAIYIASGLYKNRIIL